ncbi:hypothetical protein HDZ31DRAFT_80776 [Schizophyllum fasciatum]
MPCTEVSVLPLVAGSDLRDPSNPTAIVLKDCFDIVGRQNGFQQYFLGQTIEDAGKLVGFLDWDKVEDHLAWKEHPEYAGVGELISPIFPGGGRVFHVDFTPHEEFIKAIKAPVTEVSTYYFEDGPPADYLDKLFSLRPVVEKVDGIIASAAGITYEELEYEGVKGKAVVLVAGWQSAETHAAFKETAAYKENAALLQRSAKKQEVYHVAFVN